MFNNTKKVNMVQEQQKIKSFSLQEQQNKTKAEQKKHEMQRKNNTQLQSNKTEKKKSIFCTIRTQKSKLFGEKNRSFRRNNEHVVKKQKTEIKNAYKCQKR